MPTHDERLALRLARPQRHRLLQGYPPLPAMQSATPRHDAQRLLDGSLRGPDGTLLEPPVIRPDPQRPLLVGVLPHAMCNPRVRGCGFCTFPHERYNRKVCESVTARVLESSLALLRDQRLEGRKVAALYFGGGTATLTPMAGLARFANALAERLDLSDAEITVEGVPAHLRSWLRSPLALLARLVGRHRRVSMGVQTFDGAWLTRMGREAFGDAGTVRAVVADAHARGITASADLLFNLPGQTLPQMLEDVRRAVDCGLDQLCLYHLVLHPDLGTPWSRDPTLLAAFPGQEEACANACALREHLLSQGFVQTTLTNFERAELNATPRRFVYEELSFPPETCDALGLGPQAISTFLDLPARRGVKLVASRGVLEPVGGPSSLWFPYQDADLRLLFLTRELARTRVDRARYRRLFGADPVQDFAEVFAALEAARLLTLDDAEIRLTPRGMFFADSVVGLLAEDRVESLRPAAAGVHTRDLNAIPLSMG